MFGHDEVTVQTRKPLYEKLDYGVKYYATRKLQPFMLTRSGGIEEYFTTRDDLVEGIMKRVGPKLWRIKLDNKDIAQLIDEFMQPIDRAVKLRA